MILDDGISKNSDGKYDFDYTADLESDILKLSENESGIKTAQGLTYFFAYKFNQNADKRETKEFRTRFKHEYNNSSFFYEDSVFDFIELGMLKMDAYKKLTDFDIVFMTDYGTNHDVSVMSLLDSLMLEYTNGDWINVKLVKATYDDIKFDRDKAKNALMRTDKYRNEKKAEDAIRDIEILFETNKRNGKLFKMKNYMPVVARCGFYDFLKFDTEEHREVFESLANGSEALICGDFITSGSTVKEIERYLHSINPDVNMTVFVLVDQLREY